MAEKMNEKMRGKCGRKNNGKSDQKIAEKGNGKMG